MKILLTGAFMLSLMPVRCADQSSRGRMPEAARFPMPVTLFGLPLPVTFVKETFRFYETVPAEVSAAQAESLRRTDPSGG